MPLPVASELNAPSCAQRSALRAIAVDDARPLVRVQGHSVLLGDATLPVVVDLPLGDSVNGTDHGVAAEELVVVVVGARVAPQDHARDDQEQDSAELECIGIDLSTPATRHVTSSLATIHPSKKSRLRQ